MFNQKFVFCKHKEAKRKKFNKIPIFNNFRFVIRKEIQPRDSSFIQSNAV